MTDVTRLVKKAKRGNKDALVQLIMAQQHDYYRLAYTYVNNEADALDALENMIVLLYEKIEQLKRPESFYTWSKTILVNECRTILKKRNKVVFLEDYEGEEIHYSQDLTDIRIDLEGSLASLSAVQREAIQLKYFLDYDYETIAIMTNVPVGTAKSRVFMALKKLKKDYLRGDEGE